MFVYWRVADFNRLTGKWCLNNQVSVHLSDVFLLFWSFFWGESCCFGICLWMMSGDQASERYQNWVFFCLYYCGMTGYDGIYWEIFMVRSDRSVHHCSRHGNMITKTSGKMLGWICHTDLYEMGLKTGITPNLQVQFASSMGNRRKHMGGSINGGTPKWLVYPLKWMIWGYPYIRKPPHWRWR